MNIQQEWRKYFLKDYIRANIALTELQLNEKEVVFTDNLQEVVGSLTKDLIHEAGSLKKLAMMRPQTIFKLGSKKFFSSSMKSVKAGIIGKHPEFKEKRMKLAQEISIAARKDFEKTYKQKK